MPFNSYNEARREAQLRSACAAEEASRRLYRQQLLRCTLRHEVQQRCGRDPQRVGADVHRMARSAIEARRARRTARSRKCLIAFRVVTALLTQALADPLRHWHANRTTYQAPPRRRSRDRLGRQRPVSVEALQTLDADVVERLFKPMLMKAVPGAVQKAKKFAKTQEDMQEIIRDLKIKNYIK